MWGGTPCDEPLWDEASDQKCFFHSADEKNPDVFMEAFKLRLRAAEEAEKALDCVGFVFPDFFLPDDFEFKVYASFQDAIFVGPSAWNGARFSGAAVFGNAKFNRPAFFQGVRIAGLAYFGGALFSNSCSFNSATFSGAAGFDEALFSKRVDFSEASFSGRARFGGARFLDRAEFIGASFQGSAVFGGATFVGKVELDNAKFSGAVLFDSAKILASVSLSGTMLSGITEWHGMKLWPGSSIAFSYCEMEHDQLFEDVRFLNPGRRSPSSAWTEYGEPFVDSAACPLPRRDSHRDVRMDFRNVPLRASSNIRFQGVRNQDDPQGRINMRYVAFAHTDTARLRFRHARWSALPAWRSRFARDRPVREGDWRVADESFLWFVPGRRAVDVPDDADLIHPSLVADVYKGLRVSYENSQRYAEAGRFHVREMEMRRLAKGYPPKQGNDKDYTRRARAKAWLARNLSILNLYRILGNYGESVKRPLGWLVALWVGTFVAHARGWQGPDAYLPPSWIPVARETLDAVVPGSLPSGTISGLLISLANLILIALIVVALRRQLRRGIQGSSL